MASYYNLTNLTDSNNTLQMAVALSQLMGGNWVGNMLLILIYVITFVGTKSFYSNKAALLSSGYVTGVFGILAVAMGLVNVTVGLEAVIILGATVLYAFISRDEG